MPIDPANFTPLLRLVQPPQPADQVTQVQPTQPTQPTQPVARTEQTDSYNFESVYRAQLPKVGLTEAQARLDAIRTQLVAAQVDMPIHFEPSPVRVPAPANPYANSYGQLQPNPADLNAAATEMTGE